MTLIGARYMKWSINLIELTPDDAHAIQLHSRRNLPPALLLATAAAASTTTNNHLNRSKLATENAMRRQSDNTIECIRAVAKCSWHPKEKLYKFLNLSQFMEGEKEQAKINEKKGKTRLH